MKNSHDEPNDAFWKYLEENSKVVATWPAWLKGERGDKAAEPEKEQDQKKLAS